VLLTEIDLSGIPHLSSLPTSVLRPLPAFLWLSGVGIQSLHCLVFPQYGLAWPSIDMGMW